MTPWWIFALVFLGGVTVGGTIGAIAMAALQINRDGEDRWPH